MKEIDRVIKPFSSDGCSIPKPLQWLFPMKKLYPFCRDHDIAYWEGGSYWRRLSADAKLACCVCEVGHPIRAIMMFIAVQLFGGSYMFWADRKNEWAWGFGWRR